MRKVFLIGLFCLSIFSISQAQQEPMFTKYMFNTLIYNPAYAGAKEHLSATLLYRNQWVGLDGAPTTQTFSMHSPMKGGRAALGGSLLHDKVGATRDVKISGYYAYRIKFNETSKLSFGLSATYNNWRTDWSELQLETPIDEAFGSSYSKNLFNAGVGLFYYNPHFYVGLSVPHLLNGSLVSPDRVVNENELQAIQIRHYYLAAGLILPINTSFVFKPSFLIKNSNLFGEFGANQQSTVGAPTEFDLDLSLLMYNALWIGVSYRSAFENFSEESSDDSVDLWMAYYLRNNMRIGVSFDYSLNEIQDVSKGSFEVILGYDFAYKTSKILTPRYFF